MKRAIPALVTLSSQWLALYVCVHVETLSANAVALLLSVSVALDCVDGFAARRLGATSDFGARLDHAGDSAVAVALLVSLWAVYPIPAALVIVGTMASVIAFALTHRTRRPVSLRTLVSVAFAVARFSVE